MISLVTKRKSPPLDPERAEKGGRGGGMEGWTLFVTMKVSEGSEKFARRSFVSPARNRRDRARQVVRASRWLRQVHITYKTERVNYDLRRPTRRRDVDREESYPSAPDCPLRCVTPPSVNPHIAETPRSHFRTRITQLWCEEPPLLRHLHDISGTRCVTY